MVLRMGVGICGCRCGCGGGLGGYVPRAESVGGKRWSGIPGLAIEWRC